MNTLITQVRERVDLRHLAFTLHVANAILHVTLTNLPGQGYAVTKVFLMPLLCLFFLVSVQDMRKGWGIAWGLCGLWLGNICLIWGETSKWLFVFGSAFTVIGLFGYVWVLIRDLKQVRGPFVFLQVPVIWACAFFVLFMKDDLGHMLAPIALYMSLVAVISMLALARLLNDLSSRGSWLVFAGTLFYIAENGLYTADHYMATATFGPHIVHPCFIMAQTLIVCGYLLMESRG